MPRKSLCSLLFIAGIVLASLSACSGADRPSTSAASPKEDVLAQAMLGVDDFPAGWTKGSSRNGEAASAVGRSAGFYGTDDPNLSWVKVVQQLYLYPDNSSASAAYPNWIAKELPAMGEADSWQPTPYLEVPNHADQMTIGCLPVSINDAPVDSCRVVAQYQNMIIIIYGNLTAERWLTNEGFQNVLKAMDRRAHEALTLQK